MAGSLFHKSERSGREDEFDYIFTNSTSKANKCISDYQVYRHVPPIGNGRKFRVPKETWTNTKTQTTVMCIEEYQTKVLNIALVKQTRNFFKKQLVGKMRNMLVPASHLMLELLKFALRLRDLLNFID